MLLRTTLRTWKPERPVRTVWTFSETFLSPRDNLPIDKWMSGASFSHFKLTELRAAMDLARPWGSLTMVPFLGLGMRPLGPKTLASLTNLAIWAGVARRTSKLVRPFSI